MKDEMKEAVTNIHVRGVVYAKLHPALVHVTGDTTEKQAIQFTHKIVR